MSTTVKTNTTGLPMGDGERGEVVEEWRITRTRRTPLVAISDITAGRRTGCLVIHFSQGHAGAIEWRERIKKTA